LGPDGATLQHPNTRTKVEVLTLLGGMGVPTLAVQMRPCTILLLAAVVVATISSCVPDYSLPPPRTKAGVLGPGGPALHDEAVRELAAGKITEYRHVIHIDEVAGVYVYDCSGFVDYALSNIAPDALDALRRVRGRRRPTARTYVQLLSDISPGETRGRWLHVKEIAALQPGDVVAWLASTSKPDPWGIINTGHVMIVDGAASERSPGEWVVPVIDSSFGHGGADRRKLPEATGLGRGTIVLVVENGNLAGYRWTESARSALNRTTVALGRIQ
jgi:hypothetical protein